MKRRKRLLGLKSEETPKLGQNSNLDFFVYYFFFHNQQRLFLELIKVHILLFNFDTSYGFST